MLKIVSHAKKIMSHKKKQQKFDLLARSSRSNEDKLLKNNNTNLTLLARSSRSNEDKLLTKQ